VSGLQVTSFHHSGLYVQSEVIVQLFPLQSHCLTQGAFIRPQRGHSQPYSVGGLELIVYVVLVEVPVVESPI